MGNVASMHIVLTGAAGFLGRATIEAALAHGHRVTALLRNAPGDALPCRHIVTDLTNADVQTLANEIGPTDAVIAGAAEMSGDWALHSRSTLPATQTTAALAQTLGAHVVLVSSISVYASAPQDPGTFLDESSPLEQNPGARDGYTAAKCAQEEIIAASHPSASLLRIGALFGPGRTWNAHVGVGVGPLLCQLESKGQIPLCHVDRAAMASIRAAELQQPGAVNVLDEDLPDRARFISAHAKSGWPKVVLPLPGRTLPKLGHILQRIGLPAAKLPGLLRKPVYDARLAPRGYSASLCEAVLGPLPGAPFERLMKEALSHE